jgi:hypothetical protein
MKMIAAWLTLPFVTLVCVLAADPGHAQTRVFVAAQGSDANPCTFNAPCRTFQKAHDTVLADGEINVLDPAGYGTIFITKSISIQGHGFAGISVGNNGYAIQVVAGPTDTVNLRGLLIEGGGIHNFKAGIVYASGGMLNVQDCVIRNFEFYGIKVIGPRAYVSNTIISDNSGSGGMGIYIATTQTTRVTLNRLEIVNNFNGIDIEGDSLADGAVAWVSVNDSVIAGSGAQGIWAHIGNNLNNRFITAVITRSSIVDGPNTAIWAQGTGVLVALNQSTIANNGYGWFTASGGAVESWGNNSFIDYASQGDDPLTLRPLR